jgi:hypothetical protein
MASNTPSAKPDRSFQQEIRSLATKLDKLDIRVD